MMKIWINFQKDLTLSFRGMYLYMEIIVAFVFIAVMLFVVPENFESHFTIVAGPIESSEQAHLSEGLFADEQWTVIFVDSKNAVTEYVKDERAQLGLIIEQQDDRPVFTYVLQGHENERFINILKTSVHVAFASAIPGFTGVTDVMTLSEKSETLSDRLMIVPIFLALNSGFMGLFIIAAYIFLDKDEGVIKAFMVAPSDMWAYLLGKMGVVLLMSMVTGILTVLLLAGTAARYELLLPLLAASSVFGSALGLFIASFFNTLSKAMGWLYLFVFLLAFASVSYFMPAFSPLVIRILPSYPMIISFREVLTATPDVAYVLLSTLGFVGFGAILFILSGLRYKKTLTV